MLSKTGEIRRDESCLDYSGSDVILYPCHGSKGNQQWIYNPQVTAQIIAVDCIPLIEYNLAKIPNRDFELQPANYFL